MKTTLTQRIFSATVVAAFLLLSTTSFAALNAYLTLKGSNGKTYTTTADASGKFTFGTVEPGTYKLLWTLPKGDGEPNAASIEISSFSWGVSNVGSATTGSGMGAGKVSTTTTTTETTTTTTTAETLDNGKATQVTRSNISNNRTSGAGAGKVSVQDIHFTCDASKIRKTGNGEQEIYQTIVLENVMISSYSMPSGQVSNMTTNWDIKKNTTR